MEAAAPITVLCADDHPLMRDGIAFAIQAHPDISIVAEASNGLEAVSAYKQHRPDVTLMDLRMPEMNGIDATATILEEFPQARIIILTTYAGDVSASRAFKSGARGYLLKGALRTELISTIRKVHAGHRHIPNEIAGGIAAHVNSNELTTRELEVLQSVSTGKSNKAVADSLNISEDTVKGHVRNVLAKLRANDRTHAVMIALERGYLS